MNVVFITTEDNRYFSSIILLQSYILCIRIILHQYIVDF
jgi:hypothetical protein